MREANGMTFTVVYDTDYKHLVYGQRDIPMVLSADGKITYKAAYGASHAQIWAAVEAELQRAGR